MGTESDDWRLRGQQEYLKGATLLMKPYHIRDEKWRHDHCEFCWATLMEAEDASGDLDILTRGYGVQGRSPDARYTDDYWWVCTNCATDFAQQFDWDLQGEPAP